MKKGYYICDDCGKFVSCDACSRKIAEALEGVKEEEDEK